MVDSKKCLVDSMIRHIGQTVTIFTTSGGLSGNGFSGVLLSAECDCVRLLADIGAPPACPIGSPCSNNMGPMGSFTNEGQFYGNPLGAVCVIPTSAIKCHTPRIVPRAYKKCKFMYNRRKEMGDVFMENEKTYRILDHTEPMTEREIEEMYDGYWVYVVCAEFTETNGLIRGIPVIIGSMDYDGVEDGIYEKYKDEKYNERCSLVLTHDEFIMSLPSMQKRISA